MLSYFKLATATLLTLITISFAQDVTLNIDGTNLNYESSADIYGWQFDHDGCASGASGGASVDAGFMISCSEAICLGFSLTGSFVSLGSGTLVDLGGECSTLSGFVFAGEGGSSLDVELSDGGETCPISECGPGMHLMDGDSADCFCMLDCEHAEGGCVNGCLDSGACNYNDAANLDDGSCEYAEENYDCDGNCTAGEDCAGVCGGSAVDDECGVCGGGGAQLQDCWFDGDADGCYETLDTMTTCSCEWEGGSSTGGDCGSNTSNVDVLYCSDADIYGFQFNVNGVTVLGASGGAAEANGFTTTAGNNTVLGFSFSGTFIPGNTCDILTTLEVEGDAGATCLSDLVLAGDAGADLDATVENCLTITYVEAACDDVDADGICDDVDDCVGAYDECGDCNGDGIDEGACDCDGNVEDCAGECGGDAVVDECDVCGGDGNCGGDNSIELSFGAIADGTMEIIMNNTMPIAGFQFNVTGTDLDGAFGGRADDAGFEVSTGVEGIVLGFSLTGGQIPAGSGVLTNLNYTALADQACLTNEIFALGDWEGGFYEINIGGCADLDFTSPSSTADVLYDSDSDIAGFQFHVGGGVTLTNVYGGASEDSLFTVSFSSESGNVLGFSMTGSVVPAGTGTLITLEYTGDGSPCLSDLILSDPDANGLDATIEDCLTISYEAPVSGCTDVDACNYDASAMDDDGSCTYAEENYDCEGNCTAEVDCADECAGSAVEDCAGECGGSSVVDECGVCGGDGSSCAPGVYGLSLNDDGDLDVTFDSPDDIYGFQFDVSAVTVTGASGGAATAAGFTTSTGNNTVLGFSFSGSFIPAGSGVLTVLSFEGSGEACLSNIVVAGAGGSNLDTASGDCATIEEGCDSGIYDCAGVCDGDAVEDCAGECGGSAASDDCGVCNGGNKVV